MKPQWRFRASYGLDALTLGFNDVWVVGGRSGTLYRFDPRVHSPSFVDLAQRAGRPAVVFGHIWVGVSDHGYNDIDLVNPRTLGTDTTVDGGVGNGIGTDAAVAFRSLWGYDIRNGEVQRWHPPNPAAGVPVTDPPAFDGSCLTSLTAGYGSVWVTLAPSIEYACNFY